MDRDRASAIAHTGLAIANPIPSAVLDRFVAALALTRSDRVLEIGCGRAELLIRVVERYACTAIGIDTSARQIAMARTEAKRRVTGGNVKLIEADAAAALLSVDGFACTLCVGSTHALGGLTKTIERLHEVTRPGGRIVIGDGYWAQPPSEEYLTAWGATADEFPDLARLRLTFEEHGLSIIDQYLASVDDWDAYEEPWATNLETWAHAHAGDDPDAAEMLTWASEARARRTLGPETLGFALVLAEVPR